MEEATSFASAQDAVAAIVLDVVCGTQRDLILTHELYTLAARDPGYRGLTTDWMARSHAALERHFDAETARSLDALIEGLTIHYALDDRPRDRAEIIRAVTRITAPVT